MKKQKNEERIPIRIPENHVDWQEKARITRNYKLKQRENKISPLI